MNIEKKEKLNEESLSSDSESDSNSNSNSDSSITNNKSKTVTSNSKSETESLETEKEEKSKFIPKLKEEIEENDEEISNNKEVSKNFEVSYNNLDLEENENSINEPIDIEKEFQEKIDKIKNDYINNNIQFKDDDFPMLHSTLFKKPSLLESYLSELKNWDYRRIEDITPSNNNQKIEPLFIESDIQESDLRIGAMSDGKFTGALAICSVNKVIEKLVIDVENLHMGYAVFQFFKNGKWEYVIVDTILPYYPESKLLLFSYCINSREFWAPLIEKAYAKLHGSYEIMLNLKMRDILVDLTGGVVEKFSFLTEDTKLISESTKNFFHHMHNNLKNNCLIGCVKDIPGKAIKNCEIGEHGIYENYFHSVISVNDFPKKNINLVKVRNYWGSESVWTGPFGNNSEEWDKHKEISQQLLQGSKNKLAEMTGKYYMKFEDWIKEFNKIFIIKIFNENWNLFSIENKWLNKSAGYKFPNLKEIYLQNNELKKKAQLDSDEKWFNNPQYRIKIKKKTKLIISLMQEDKVKSNKKNYKYVATNFIIVKNTDKINRIWKMPKEEHVKLIGNRNQKDEKIRRELTNSVTLYPFEGKEYGYYTIICNMEEELKKDEKKTFWLRIFSSEKINLEEIKDSIKTSVKGEWDESTYGGPYYLNDNKENPNWCKNPQYFLNVNQPTHLKIVLKKIKTGKTQKKLRENNIGLVICMKDNEYEPVIFDKPMRDANNKIIMDPTVKLIKQTQAQLKPPILNNLERKIKIEDHEFYVESTYGTYDLACLYFHFLPIQGPFIIVPCLDKEGVTSEFTLDIFSNNPIELEKLDNEKNSVIISEWKDYSSGGCHLYEPKYYVNEEKHSWNSNPTFLLKFKDKQKRKITIKLLICEKNWKGKIFQNINNKQNNNLDKPKKSKIKNVSVGSMISIYILKNNDKILDTTDIIQKSQFVPSQKTQIEFELEDEDCLVMPSTYMSKIEGKFIISVKASDPFEFKRFH